MSMHTTNLSRATVERTKPKASSFRLWDAKISGLFLHVQLSGVKSWNVQWPRTTSKSLGKYPAVTDEAARVRTRAMLTELDKQGAPLAVIEKRADKPGTLGQFMADHYAPHVEATNKVGEATVALSEAGAAIRDALTDVAKLA